VFLSALEPIGGGSRPCRDGCWNSVNPWHEFGSLATCSSQKQAHGFCAPTSQRVCLYRGAEAPASSMSESIVPWHQDTHPPNELSLR
jgi:hypothetical protein